MGARATQPVLAAALVHGKTASGLATLPRVLSTVAISLAGRSRVTTWQGGLTGRIGLYSRHPELGAELLAGAGSDKLTVAWAREHHRPEDPMDSAPLDWPCSPCRGSGVSFPVNV
jgi:hypothetical protein